MQTHRFAVFTLAVVSFVHPLLGQSQGQPNEAPRRTPMLMMGGSRSFLGVGVVEVTSDRAKALRLKEEHGVEVTRVDDESPAARAGLKPQDIVLEYQGQRVEGVEQFARLVRETPAGRDVKLLVHRAGQPLTIVAALESRKVRLVEVGDMQVAIPRISALPDIQIGEGRREGRSRMAILGVEAERLEPQLAEYFGVREGVLVRSVSAGSAAEKAGMKAGDVITKVGETQVATPVELIRQLQAAEGKSASLTLVRDRKTMAFNVSLEADNEPGRPKARAVRIPEP